MTHLSSPRSAHSRDLLLFLVFVPLSFLHVTLQPNVTKLPRALGDKQGREAGPASGQSAGTTGVSCQSYLEWLRIVIWRARESNPEVHAQSGWEPHQGVAQLPDPCGEIWSPPRAGHLALTVYIIHWKPTFTLGLKVKLGCGDS